MRQANLLIFTWLLIFWFGLPSVCLANSSNLLKWPFFYNDIQSFFGQPYRSQSFKQVQKFSQEFQSSCANFDRIVLPVYLNSIADEDNLNFSLYDLRSGKLITSSDLSIQKLPAQKPIGSYRQKGTMVNIWFDPVKDSKDAKFRWVLEKSRTGDFSDAGIYLTTKEIQRLGFVLQEGEPLHGSHAAFYSYCQFRFDWGEIGSEIGARLSRESFFLSGFIFTLFGLAAAIIRKNRKQVEED